MIKTANIQIMALGVVSMKRFEYKVVPVKKGTFTSGEKYAEQFAAELNSFGAEGWELIELSGNASLEGYVLQVYKRELA